MTRTIQAGCMIAPGEAGHYRRRRAREGMRHRIAVEIAKRMIADGLIEFETSRIGRGEARESWDDEGERQYATGDHLLVVARVRVEE